ncbi:hypothetical protein B0T10DRAFT_96397 [Thelonectria olida]|uniref:Small secreted protein n=1 Tax=Thelonectria olida TaxID=1576542 RepID=A0A9P8VXW5_9HYPO|nr:hypothetical protein B0T10DRAFT_96397 [Thelonectria olida]
MQLTALLCLFTASAMAAPAAVPENAKSMMAATPMWTIRNMKRVCNSADTQCVYTFRIDTTGPSSTDCKYIHNGKPASETSGGPAQCGKFAVTSGWSGQFGPNNGFTTLSVVHTEARQIIWPAYTDKQLDGGQVVKPDQAYAPQSLP